MEFPQLPKEWSAWHITRQLESGPFCSVYEMERIEGMRQKFSIVKVYNVPSSETEGTRIVEEKGSREAVQLHFRLMADSYIQNLKLQEEMRICSKVVYLEDFTIEEKSDGIGWTIFARTERLNNFRKYYSAHHDPRTGHPSLSENEVLKFGMDICEALSFCEHSHIIIKGISTDRFFVANDLSFKLGNLDDAVRGDTVALEGSMGTMRYQAPEVLVSQTHSHIANIYELGIFMYTQLNQGNLPFVEGTRRAPNLDQEANMRRYSGEPLPPPVSASPEIAEVILKACSYRPKDRYQTADAFLHALQNVYHSKTSDKSASHKTASVTESAKKTPFEILKAAFRMAPAASSSTPQTHDHGHVLVQQTGHADEQEHFDPYIFISYAHRDKDIVHPIIDRLNTDGFRIWYDAGIDPGTEWDENIASHVEQCQLFIALISKAYLESENCKDELIYARDLNKKRILVYLEEVNLPGGLKMRLNRLQAIHFYAYPDQDSFFQRFYAVSDVIECRK